MSEQAVPSPAGTGLSRGTIIGGLLTLVFVGGFTSYWLANGDESCTAESFTFPEVERACAEGGRKAVNVLMKDAVKRAKAAGESMTCKSCHTDMTDWGLTPNAIDDYRKWRE